MAENFIAISSKSLGYVRYEVCICILTGDIVWINGPYQCGTWPDISIFRDSLKSFLAPNERVEADDGYIGEAPENVKCPKSFTNPAETEYVYATACTKSSGNGQ